jgi:transglutaminase-like putative cysteine protease
MKQLLLAMTILFLTVAGAFAEPMSEADIPVRYSSWHTTYDLNSDGSYVEAQSWSATVLKQTALEGHKNGSVTFSTSVAKGEILEAYTLKKSGQRIDVPKNSYQVTIHDGYNNASPLYSDETTISVVFPDLAVGDSVHFSSRVTNSEGMFPDQFSMAHYFSRYTALNDASIVINAPAAMSLKQQSFFLTESPAVIKEGKQTLRWTFTNKTPEKWTPADNGIPVIGDSPSLFVSTFRNYREIVEAYGVRATPKANATERVKKLAAEIAADRTAPEEQARSIYDWVAKNISYGGNCIGIGAVVPRDLDVVLDNKLGDCKDHATLLQALLTAKNIDSEQALINAGSSYQLPGVPVVSAVNHVINYLPKLNLFLDATSSSTPFGMLPESLAEKPVLLVSHYREGMKTPSTAQYGHGQTMRTRITINADGSAGGEMELSLKGIPAVGARAIMRVIPRDREDLVAKKFLEGQGSHGTATLKKDDPVPLLDTYSFGLSFKLDDFVTVGTATGIHIKPVASSILPIDGFLGQAYEPAPNRSIVCSGGSSVEEYVLDFPPTIKIIGIPKDFELSTVYLDYKATYRKTENRLTVRRELKDKTASNVCSPEFSAGYKKALLSVAKDLKSQVILSD